jgi:hypothetical protein
VQTRRGFVQQHQVAGPRLGHLAGQPHALGFATGKARRRLPERQIAQPDLLQGLQDAGHRRVLGEHRTGLVNAQRQHIGDRPIRPGRFEDLGSVAPAIAGLARNPDRREIAHLDRQRSHPLAIRTGALCPVEGEVRGRASGLAREDVADTVEHLGVRRRIRPWVVAQRRLIHRPSLGHRRVERRTPDRPTLAQGGQQHLVAQGGLACS